MANIEYEYTRQWEDAVTDPKTGKKYYNIGYWPGFSKSGLTIGYGIDLAYFTRDDLEDAGVNKEDIDKVDKYLAKHKGYNVYPGLRGGQIASKIYPDKDILIRDAKGARAGFKIIWDDQSTNKMQKYVEDRFTSSAKNTYEKLNKDSKKFHQLTKAQQTVLYSITSNAGENFIEYRTKNLKKHIINNDWEAIEAELLSPRWESNLSRRNDEGMQLKNDRIKRQNEKDKAFLLPDEEVMKNAFG